MGEKKAEDQACLISMGVLDQRCWIGAGSMAKGLTISSGDGGNVGYAMKVWLSTSPTSTFDSTSDACKNNSTTQPYIITGPGYCPITPNTKYYLFMSVDEDASNLRYKVHEGSSDFY